MKFFVKSSSSQQSQCVRHIKENNGVTFKYQSDLLLEVLSFTYTILRALKCSFVRPADPSALWKGGMVMITLGFTCSYSNVDCGVDDIGKEKHACILRAPCIFTI